MEKNPGLVAGIFLSILSPSAIGSGFLVTPQSNNSAIP